MPASEPLPTIQELVRAYHGGARSERAYEDAHDGSMHDILAGVGALLWRRVAEHDRDEFRRIYFDTAPRDALNEYIERRFQLPRIEDTAGVGTAYLSRPTAAGGAGMFWAGTRIRMNSGRGDPLRLYEAVADTPATGSAVSVEVPVRALTFEEKLFDVSRGSVTVLDLADPVWDPTWGVDRLHVEAGVTGETNDEYRARARANRVADRVGYPEAIRRAMVKAGAGVVAFFQGDFLGDALDAGLNRVYVADAGYETSAELLTACRLALPRVVVAGTSAQALPVTNQPISVQVTVRMFDQPYRFDQPATIERAVAAIYEYFRTRDNPFIWREAGVRGAIFRAVPNSQDAIVTASLPAPDLPTLFDSSPLKRFTVARQAISVTLQGPA